MCVFIYVLKKFRTLDSYSCKVQLQLYKEVTPDGVSQESTLRNDKENLL